MIKARCRIARKNWLFGKQVLILQVLEKYDDGPLDANGLPSSLAGERWRDATVEDLTMLGLFETSPTSRCARSLDRSEYVLERTEL